MRISRKQLGDFFKRVKAKLVPKRIHLIEKSLRGGIIAFSPEFKAFLKKKHSFLSPTLQLIIKNEKRLNQGEIIEDKKREVVLHREATGSYKGRHLTLKVTVDGKEFFLKIFVRKESKSTIESLKKADLLLRKIRYRIKGFRVRVIKPHLIYSSPHIPRSFLVTDFYNEGDTQQVLDLPFNPKTIKIYEALDEVSRYLGENGLDDVTARNSFFEPKTNTILLYDVIT